MVHRGTRRAPRTTEAGARSPSGALSLADAVPLATALVQRVADSAGTPMLVLKGPLAHLQGLRPDRPSTDVDVLTSPDAAGALVAALGEHGWTPRSAPDFPSLLVTHSRTLSHPGWPVDIDLHDRWPGFLLDPGEAFDVLWARRRSLELAGVPVTTTGEADTVLILALHGLREYGHLTIRDRRIAEYEHLIAAIQDRSELVRDLRDAAAMLGAEQTARPFLLTLGFDIAEQPPDEALHRWRAHSMARHPVAGWLYELKRAPWRRKIPTVWHAVFPAPEELRAIDPAIESGQRGLISAWWRRLRRGIKTVPLAAEDLRRSR